MHALPKPDGTPAGTHPAHYRAHHAATWMEHHLKTDYSKERKALEKRLTLPQRIAVIASLRADLFKRHDLPCHTYAAIYNQLQHADAEARLHDAA